MADINLLQNSKQSPTATIALKNPGSLNRWLNWIGVVLLVLTLGASGYLYMQNKSLSKTVADQQQQATELQAQIAGIPNYAKLIRTQNKLSDLKAVLNAHLDWSQLLPKFFNATLKTAAFTKFSADGSGGAIINGTVPSFVELDKMIQGFQITPFDQYIKDVQLVNVGNGGGAGTGTVAGIQFTLNITFNNSILGLQVPAGTKVSTPAMQTTTTPTTPTAPASGTPSSTNQTAGQ